MRLRCVRRPTVVRPIHEFLHVLANPEHTTRRLRFAPPAPPPYVRLPPPSPSPVHGYRSCLSAVPRLAVCTPSSIHAHASTRTSRLQQIRLVFAHPGAPVYLSRRSLRALSAASRRYIPKHASPWVYPPPDGPGTRARKLRWALYTPITLLYRRARSFFVRSLLPIARARTYAQRLSPIRRPLLRWLPPSLVLFTNVNSCPSDGPRHRRAPRCVARGMSMLICFRATVVRCIAVSLLALPLSRSALTAAVSWLGFFPDRTSASICFYALRSALPVYIPEL
ncbi:hypothetical protein HYPSUDRAFT_209973 [Hypholoma sublateritium FD-334 SS-4]|uniref:Uncharacterized protein n=1 Tax=Hypholoma sublateritium (strain FD-334 SS-4) TaxID=945553 RepID=A0A0D2N164_HYPSF|nr:hypothetical protein HYPSUDRAFT_209973 [Hypholoma sublateritium FD-334 SS-4]